MRIACLQFAPEVGDVENNIRRANTILEQADLRSVDLLVLPELAFAGYKFKSLKHITPCLEDIANGVTARWARTTAKKYDCFVVVGYAETVDVRDNWPTDPKYYNSAMMVNPAGETVMNYRKTHLYCLDETWALEGPEGLYDGNILGLGDFAMGIGMDLKFTAPESAWEFAHHVLHKDATLVIISMAWMTSQSIHEFTAEKNMPDLDTLAYWLSRLEPLIRREFGDEIIVVISSRCGIDDGIVYAGTSCVLGMQEGEIKVYGMLGRGNIELLIVDTTVLEKGKLVAMQNSVVAQDVLQSRKAREYLASNQLAVKEKRLGRERSPQSQVSSTSRNLIRAIPRVEVKPLDESSLPPIETISQYRFFGSPKPSSIGRREKQGSQWPEASQSVSAAPTSSVEPLPPLLNLRTFVEAGASQEEVDSWDNYSDDSLIAPTIDTARPTQLRSGSPDDGPDSAWSTTVNSPWDDDDRSVPRAEDITTAMELAGTRPEHGTPRDMSPTLPSFVYDPSRVGGCSRQLSNSIILTALPFSEEPNPSSSTSIVPPLFPSSVPPTERPQSPKSRNTSRPGSSQRASTSAHQDLIDQLQVITGPFERITAGLSGRTSFTDPLQPDPEASPTPSAEGSTSPKHQNYIW